MNKVLFVAYQIPPIGGPAAQRHIRFLNRLEELEWCPVVLTVNPECCEDYYLKDSALEKWLPSDLLVVRTRAFNPMDRFLEWRKQRKRNPGATFARDRLQNSLDTCSIDMANKGKSSFLKDFLVEIFRVPDRQVGWIPFAVARGLRILHSKDIQIIYSSGNPWSSHIIGMFLSLLSGLPWVADFRDPWISNPYKKKRPAVIEAMEKRLEQLVVRRAKKLIANTPFLLQDFIERYPAEDRKKFVHISNGFFAPMFESLVNHQHVDRERFVISHVGTLYAYRNPLNLLKSLSDLKRQGLIASQNFLLRFIGKIDFPEINPAFLNKLGIDDIVELVGPVSHKEALGFLASSDLLLLIQPGTALQIPGKLFEYIAVGKPIIAIADQGALSDIICKEGLGMVVQDDEDKLKKVVLDAVIRYQKGLLYGPSKETIEKYESLNLTRQLVSVFRSCLQA